MGQAMGTEPENPTARCGLSRKTQHVREMEPSEHAALVETIRLNFPEIYEDPACPSCGPQSDADGTADSEIEPSAAA
jgi:hypothetical protein